MAFTTTHGFLSPLNFLIHPLISAIWVGASLDTWSFCLTYPSPIIIHFAKPIQILLHSECPQLELVPCFTPLYNSFLFPVSVSLTFALCLHACFLRSIDFKSEGKGLSFSEFGVMSCLISVPPTLL